MTYSVATNANLPQIGPVGIVTAEAAGPAVTSILDYVQYTVLGGSVIPLPSPFPWILIPLGTVPLGTYCTPADALGAAQVSVSDIAF